MKNITKTREPELLTDIEPETPVQPTEQTAMEPARPRSVRRVKAEAPAASAQSEIAIFERLAANPNIDLDRLERMMSMVRAARKERQEIAFNAALSRASKNIKAAVTNSYSENTKSWFATYEALDAVARPHYTDEGLALTYKPERSELGADYILIVCLVKHEGGHTERYALDMPADGKGAKGGDVMTKTHATGSAISYAMRYLLRMVFNIPVKDRDDDDGVKAAGTVEKKIPPAPKGWAEWWEELQAVADNGIEELEDAWQKTKKGDFKTYAIDHYRQQWADLKAKAAKVSADRARR